MALVDHGRLAWLGKRIWQRLVWRNHRGIENLEKMAQSAYELGIRDASDRLVKFYENH